MNNFNTKIKKITSFFSIIIGLSMPAAVFADDIVETVVSGKVKPTVTTSYLKKIIDGQSLTTVTDTSITAGSIGLRVVNGTANYDNLVVTANQ